MAEYLDKESFLGKKTTVGKDEFLGRDTGRTVGGTLKDIGVSAAKSVVGTGQAAVGLGNIATGGLLGKALDKVGYDPQLTQDVLSKGYSPAQQEANKNVADAEGFIGTTKALVQNPSVIGHKTVETLGPMGLGGGIAQAGLKTATRVAPKLATKLAGPGSAMVAGALGEGAVSAGSMAEELRQEDPNKELSMKDVGASVGAGTGTALFGAVGGRIAQKLGLTDVDTLLASGKLSKKVKDGGVKEIAKRVVGGGISEGVFEELPQSIQETIWQNAALDKPLLEGVPETAAESILIGGTMGAGVNLLPRDSRAEEAAPQPAEPPKHDGPVSKALSRTIAGTQPAVVTQEQAETMKDERDRARFPGTAPVMAGTEQMERRQFAGTQPATKDTADLIDEIAFDSEFRKGQKEKSAQATESRKRKEREDFLAGQQAQERPLAERQFLSAYENQEEPLRPYPGAPPTSQNIIPEEEVEAFRQKVRKDHQFRIARELMRQNERQANKEKRESARIDKELAAPEVPDEVRKNAEQEARALVNENPVYQHMAEIKKRGGLNLEAFGNDYDATSILAIQRKYPGLISRVGNVQPDDFANEAGYESLDAMVQAISGAKTKKQVQAELQRQLMDKWQDSETQQQEISDFTFADEQIAAGSLQPGDEIVLADNTRLKHSGFDDRGSAVFTGDGQRITADPFDVFDIVAKKQSHDPAIRREATGTQYSRAAAGQATGQVTGQVVSKDSVANGQEVNTAPTEAQKEAGNYKKAHVNLDGLDISIENPAGSTRSGTDANGRKWSQKLKNDYGYIRGTTGKDKDHLDIFVKPGYEGGGKSVFVVNQVDGSGRFDEHKIVIGATTEEEARQIYRSNYETGWDRDKSIVEMPIEQFKEWAKSDQPQKGELKTPHPKAEGAIEREAALPLSEKGDTVSEGGISYEVLDRKQPRQAGDVRRDGTEVQSPTQLYLFTETSTDQRQARKAKRKLYAKVEHAVVGEFSGVSQINDFGDVAQIVNPIFDEAQENIVIVMADDTGKPVSVLKHTVGGQAVSQAFPQVILGTANSIPSVKKIWLAHNHPSGTMALSPQDFDLESRISKLAEGTGVSVEGMIAVNKDGEFTGASSTGATGTGTAMSAKNAPKIKWIVRKLSRVSAEKPITGPDQVESWVKQNIPGESGIILYDTALKPTMFVAMDVADMQKLRTGDKNTGASLILAEAERTNSTAAVVVSRANEHPDKFKNILKFLDAHLIRAVDVVRNGTADQQSIVSNYIDPGKVGTTGPGAYESVAAATGTRHTDATLQEELSAKLGRDFPSLLRRGKLKIHATAQEAEAAANYSFNGRRVQGLYKDGTVHLIAPNINKGEGFAVLKHELGMHLRQALTNDPFFQKLEESLKRRQNNDSPTGRAIRQAMARVPAGTKDSVFWAETAAYLVEQSPDNVSLYRRIVARIKKALVDMGFPADLFTAADINAIAIDAIRKEARGGAIGTTAQDILESAAWHGSPRRFDKFDISKIGTGEGAQAYGYGLYFTSKKSIAEWYRNNLVPDKYRENATINNIAKEYKEDAGGDTAAAIVAAQKDLSEDWIDKKRVRRAIRVLETGKPLKVTEGGIYQVELAPKDDEYLLWDRPLSEQSEKVRAALASDEAVEELQGEQATVYTYSRKDDVGNELEAEEIVHFTSNKKAEEFAQEERKKKRFAEVHKRDVALDYSGGQIYNWMTGFAGSDKAASEYLHSLGIRGIKYLDGSSRGKGEGDYNYVIFDDADVEITDIMESVAAEDLSTIDKRIRAKLTRKDNPAASPATYSYGIQALKDRVQRKMEQQAIRPVRTGKKRFVPATAGAERFGRLKTATGKPSPAKITRALQGYEQTIADLKNDKIDTAEKLRILEKFIVKAARYARGHADIVSLPVRIAEAKTEKARLRLLNVGIDRIERINDAYVKRQAITDMLRLIRKSGPKLKDAIEKQTTGGYGLNQELVKIKAVLQMKPADVQAEMARLEEMVMNNQMFTEAAAERIDALIEKRANGELSTGEEYELRSLIADGTIGQLKRLSTYGMLKQATGYEAEQALRQLKAMVAGKQSEWIDEMIDLRTQRQQQRTEAVDVISGSKGLLNEDQEQQLKADRQKPWRKWRDIIKGFDDKHQSWEWLLDKLSRFDKAGILSSKLVQRYGTLVNEATNKEQIALADTMAEMQLKMAEIFGANGRQLEKILAKNSQIIKQSGVFRRADDGTKANEIAMSQNMAYKRWQEWQDPTLRDQLTSQGFTDETMAEIESFMAPAVKTWAEWQLREFYPSYYSGVNEVFRAMFYTDMPHNPNYSPIKRRYDKGEMDDNLLNRMNPYSSVIGSSLKQRVQNNRPILLQDGDTVLAQHIAQMEHFKAWAEPMREMRSVLGSEQVRMAVDQYHGTIAKQVMTGFLDDFARGKVDQRIQSQLVTYFRSRFTTAAIGANPVVLIKQLTSIPAFALDMPQGQWLKRMSFMANPAELSRAYKTLMASPKMKERYRGGFERDMILAMSDSSGMQRSGFAKWADRLMVLVKIGDGAAIIGGGWPLYTYHYDQAIGQGKSEQEAKKIAMEKFETAVDRSQQAGNLKDLNAFQRSGPFAQLFTMFMTAPNAYYRHWSGGLRVMRGATAQDWKDAAAGRNQKLYDAAKRVWITQVVLPAFFALATSAFNWDEDEMLKGILLGPMQGLVFMRDIGTALTNAILGQRNWATGNTPVLSTLEEAVQTIGKARRHIFAFQSMEPHEWLTDETMLAILKDGATVAGNLSGIPVGPMSRTAAGITAAATGQTVDPVRRSLGYAESRADTARRKFNKAAGKIRDAGKEHPHYRALLRQQRINTRLNSKIKRAIENDASRAEIRKLYDERAEEMLKFLEKIEG